MLVSHWYLWNDRIHWRIEETLGRRVFPSAVVWGKLKSGEMAFHSRHRNRASAPWGPKVKVERIVLDISIPSICLTGSQLDVCTLAVIGRARKEHPLIGTVHPTDALRPLWRWKAFQPHREHASCLQRGSFKRVSGRQNTDSRSTVDFQIHCQKEENNLKLKMR